MPNNDDLKNAYKPEDKDGDGVPDFAENKLDSVPEEAFEYYKKIYQEDSTFWQRLGHFIRAENKAGRKAKIIKDGILVFAPWGKQVSDATELVTELISDNSNKKPDTMKEPKFKKIKRYLKQKSTQSAIALIATVVSAVFAGVEINPDVLTESLLGIITGLAATWASIMAIVEMFRDEDNE